MPTTGPYAGLVAEHGLAASHELVLRAVPAGSRVLDVGCATGYLAIEFARRDCHVIGVEIDPQAAAIAREATIPDSPQRRALDAVVVGDLEVAATREAVKRELGATPPDVIVCGDVLEHLRDPQDVLTWLGTLLGPGGRAVVSLPNIGHWTARRELVRGRFPYADFGLFDTTHLRFFTRASATELAHRSGFDVLEEHPAPASLPLESHLPALGRFRERAVRRFPELLALQVVLVLEPRQPLP
jgi:SAM-dependent methyltransferase